MKYVDVGDDKREVKKRSEKGEDDCSGVMVI
jgi:hypothetical protein